MIDHRIAMMGQQPNILGQLAQGTQAAGQVAALRRQAEGQNLFRQYGPGIAAGDPAALNRLAQFDPQASLDVQQSRQAMQINTARLDQIRQQTRLAIEQNAANLDAAEAAREREQIVMGLKRVAPHMAAAMKTGDVQPLNMVLAELGQGTVQSLDDALALFTQYDEAARALEGVIGMKAGPSAGNSPTTQSAVVLEDGTTIMPMKDGTVLVRDPYGNELTGQARVDAIRAGRQYEVENEQAIYGARRQGTNIAEAETGAQAAAAGQRGKEGVKLASEFFQDRRNVSSNIRNIRSAIQAIDEGAKSGVVYNMLPNVTLASASLKNAMNEMGLDVVGSVTFGALSEGELRLAMDTAVPQGLDAPELRKWLLQKQEAQEKALEALDEAIMHFDGGGTMSEWTQKVKEWEKAAKSEDDDGAIFYDPATGKWSDE